MVDKLKVIGNLQKRKRKIRIKKGWVCTRCSKKATRVLHVPEGGGKIEVSDGTFFMERGKCFHIHEKPHWDDGQCPPWWKSWDEVPCRWDAAEDSKYKDGEIVYTAADD
jgi:hypothetical protein